MAAATATLWSCLRASASTSASASVRPRLSLLPLRLRAPLRRTLTSASAVRAEALAPNAFTPVPPEANGYGTGMSNNPDSNDSNSGGGGNSRNGEVNITYGPTRRVPASPSYFTGNADFFDNYLALQELVRRYQTLPTIPRDAAPHVKWKTLAQYRGIVGISVKAARYKQIVNMLARLNCIHPELLPAEVRTALDLYKRDERGAANQAREKTLDNSLRAYAVGRRKTSSAKVYVIEGDGEVLVNGKPLQEVFARLHDRESAVWPLIVTGRMDKYNVWATVEGGGTTGQAEAITLGVARALLVHEPALKPALRRAGCVTRDPRMVERKKPGHLKARKMPTWVKR